MAGPHSIRNFFLLYFIFTSALRSHSYSCCFFFLLFLFFFYCTQSDYGYYYMFSVAISPVKCRHNHTLSAVLNWNLCITHTNFRAHAQHSQTVVRCCFFLDFFFFATRLLPESIDVIRMPIIGHIFNLNKKKKNGNQIC